MSTMNRREFVGAAAATAGALALAQRAAAGRPQAPRKASDKVKLGTTGITVSLLGIGTGTIGAGGQSNQTRLGQPQFTAMIRHAYDNGITLFDAADQYGSHTFLREALKGIPRDRYVVQTKTNERSPEGVRTAVERFRAELGVDTVDVVLLHCLMESDWPTRYRPAMDAMEDLRQKRVIRAHGVSCHTFGALEAAAAEPWVQVDLARFNPWGRIMDNPPEIPNEQTPGRVQAVLGKMRAAGKGVIGMKILAEGRAVRGDDRLARARESLRFALGSGALHAMVIGFESPKQITEIIGETRAALADVAAGKVASTDGTRLESDAHL